MIHPAVWIQYLVPQHLLSRTTGYLADCTWTWLKKPVIKLFIFLFKVDMSEAMESDPDQYSSFNDFFTRQLRDGARPMCEEDEALISPVDGTVSQAGEILQGQLLQAKGRSYPLDKLLGNSEDRSRPFLGGQFATLYLSPRDYHRVHAPMAGTLIESVYIPGKLFSVDEKTSRHVPDLFATNERLVMIFETAAGPLAAIMVGAMIVAGIETVWRGGSYPPGTLTEEIFNGSSVQSPQFRKGDELGRFKLGSTVILLAGQNAVTWSTDLKEGHPVRLGEKIGIYTPSEVPA